MSTILNATAVIRARDLFSGPVTQMASRVLAAQKRIQDAGRLARSIGHNMSLGITAPLGLGFAAIIASTQEFEEALVGVQVAGIADNLKEGHVEFGKLRADAEAVKAEALRLSAALRLRPTGLLLAGEAAAKMGLSADKLSTLMEMAGSVNIQDKSLAPGDAAEFLGSMGIMFNAGARGASDTERTASYNSDIARIANQMLAVAGMTRTSAGRLQDGLRQFAPLYASFGESFADTASMVGAMVQAGQADVESGTALKSLGIRMLKPTYQGRNALAASGLSQEIRARGLIDMTGVTADKALKNLKMALPGQIGKSQEKTLFAKLVEGERRKLFTDETWQNEFIALVNEVTRARDAPTREANQEKVLTSLLSGGGQIKMFEILKLLGEKLASGELTELQMADIGEGRHLSRYKALFKMLPFMQQLHGQIAAIDSQWTDAGNKLHRDSTAGTWEGALAALQRATIRLRESKGVTSLVEGIARLGEAIAAMPAERVELIGKAIAVLAIAAPVGLALSGLANGFIVLREAAGLGAMGFGLIGKASKGLQRGLMAPFRVLAANVALFRAMPGAVGKVAFFAFQAFRGIGTLALGARTLATVVMGVLGAINWPAVLGVAALMLVIDKWNWLKGFFSELGAGLADTALGRAFATLVGWIETPLILLKELWGWLSKVFNFGVSASDDEAAGRGAARRMLGWFGIERQPERSFDLDDAIAQKARADAGGAGKPTVSVHAPATVSVTINGSASETDVKAAVARALEANNQKLRASLQGAFND